MIKEKPNDLELEKTILGMALIADELQDSAALALVNTLVPGDFHNDTHQEIIAAIKTLIKENKSVTLAVLKTEFPKAAWLNEADLLATLEPSTADLEIHIAKLKDYAHRRRVIESMLKLESKAYGSEITNSELLNLMSAEIGSLAQIPVISPAIDEIDNFYNSLGTDADRLGLVTGFELLDSLTLGFRKLILLAGEPKLGKTSFMIQIAGSMARRDIPVLFYSLELTRIGLITRLLSCLSGVDVNELQMKGRPYLTGDKKEIPFEKCISGKVNLSDCIPAFEDTLSRLYIRDQVQGLSFDVLESDIKQIQEKTGQQNILVIVDHLQIFPIPASEYSDTIDKENIKIARFNDIQKRTGAAIVLISQLNKSAIQEVDKRGKVSMAGVKGSVDNVYLSHFIITMQGGQETETYREVILNVISRDTRGGSLVYYYNGAQSQFSGEKYYKSKHEKNNTK